MTDLHWQEIRKHIHPVEMIDTQGLVAIDETGKLLAAQIFCNRIGQSIETHSLVLSRRPLFHGWLDLIHHYVFNTLGVGVLFGLVPEDNKRAIAINSRLGGKITGRIPDGHAPGVDFVVMSLKAEERRYGR